MTDDRDFSWMGRAAPSPGKPVERRIAVMVKDARSVRLLERAHPLGRELVCLMASDLVWAQTFRPGQDAAFDAEVQAALDALTRRGWAPAE